MLESDFTAQVTDALEGIGAICFKVHGHAMQKAGWPDLQVYLPRWTGHIELKVDTDCSTLQKIVIGDLLQRGTPALVLRWIAGAVQAEDTDMQALGHIPADQWRRTATRSQAIISLLEMATLHMRETGRLRPWVPNWQMDENGCVVGQQAFEKSTRPVQGREATERAMGGGRVQTNLWRDGRENKGGRGQ